MPRYPPAPESFQVLSPVPSGPKDGRTKCLFHQSVLPKSWAEYSLVLGRGGSAPFRPRLTHWEVCAIAERKRKKNYTPPTLYPYILRLLPHTRPLTSNRHNQAMIELRSTRACSITPEIEVLLYRTLVCFVMINHSICVCFGYHNYDIIY